MCVRLCLFLCLNYSVLFLASYQVSVLPPLPSFFFLTGSLIRVSDEFLVARFHSSSACKKIAATKFPDQICLGFLLETGRIWWINLLTGSLTWPINVERCGNIILYLISSILNFPFFLFFLYRIEFINVVMKVLCSPLVSGKNSIFDRSMTEFRKLSYTKITNFPNTFISCFTYIYIYI